IRGYPGRVLVRGDPGNRLARAHLAAAFSFMTVRTRAMSRRVLRSWDVLVSCWVAICMRSEKCAFSRSPSSFFSASSSLARSSLAFIFLPLRRPASGADHAGYEDRRDRQLGGREREGLAGQLLV